MLHFFTKLCRARFSVFVDKGNMLLLGAFMKDFLLGI